MEPKGERLLKVGELADLVGLDTQTLRNYERQGLLQPAARSEAGQHRLYGAEQVAQLRFVRRANQVAGLRLAEVRELLALIADGKRGENLPRLRGVLEEKLRQTERRMEELSAFRDSLLHYLSRFEEEED
jgi:MerR family transcriptional regulator, Zn(II)-responsive regulator of zntA